jgi:hypothetical protein
MILLFPKNLIYVTLKPKHFTSGIFLDLFCLCSTVWYICTKFCLSVIRNSCATQSATVWFLKIFTVQEKVKTREFSSSNTNQRLWDEIGLRCVQTYVRRSTNRTSSACLLHVKEAFELDTEHCWLVERLVCCFRQENPEWCSLRTSRVTH